MVLNSYITIFSTTKTQNVPYNSGAKVIFFYSQLQCTSILAVYGSWKVKKKNCIHTTFLIFFILSSTFHFAFTLLFLSSCFCAVMNSHYFSSLRVSVQWFLWLWWRLWLCVGGLMKYNFIVMFILVYCVKS